jgi:hypothetical protein
MKYAVSGMITKVIGTKGCKKNRYTLVAITKY